MRIFISFDFDRTLADHSRAHGNAILSSVHHSFGKRFQVNWFDVPNSGLTDTQLITLMAHNHGISFEDIFSTLPGCFVRMASSFEKHLQKYPVQLLDGVYSTLGTIFRLNNTFLGLSTGNAKDVSLRKLQTTGIYDFFSFGSFGDEVFDRYQLLRLTMARLIHQFNFSSSDIAIHVGDSMLDMLSARKAGFIPIGVSTGSSSKNQLFSAGASIVLANLSYLPSIIQSILYESLDLENSLLSPLIVHK